jgi:hypothetical protein
VFVKLDHCRPDDKLQTTPSKSYKKSREISHNLIMVRSFQVSITALPLIEQCSICWSILVTAIVKVVIRVLFYTAFNMVLYWRYKGVHAISNGVIVCIDDIALEININSRLKMDIYN